MHSLADGAAISECKGNIGPSTEPAPLRALHLDGERHKLLPYRRINRRHVHGERDAGKFVVHMAVGTQHVTDEGVDPLCRPVVRASWGRPPAEGEAIRS